MSETLFQWDPAKFSVHVDSMDREHQKLISIMNKLYERSQAGASKSELGLILNELGDYTVYHFTSEEKYFSQIPYAQAQSHKLIHKELLTRFQTHAEQFAKEGKLSEDFFRFLKTWLMAHIVGIDSKYGEIKSA